MPKKPRVIHLLRAWGGFDPEVPCAGWPTRPMQERAREFWLTTTERARVTCKRCLASMGQWAPDRGDWWKKYPALDTLKPYTAAYLWATTVATERQARREWDLEATTPYGILRMPKSVYKVCIERERWQPNRREPNRKALWRVVRILLPTFGPDRTCTLLRTTRSWGAPSGLARWLVALAARYGAQAVTRWAMRVRSKMPQQLKIMSDVLRMAYLDDSRTVDPYDFRMLPIGFRLSDAEAYHRRQIRWTNAAQAVLSEERVEQEEGMNRMLAIRAAVTEAWAGGRVGEYDVRVPGSMDEFRRLAQAQANCVAGYAGEVANGRTEIVYFAKEGKPVFTVEWRGGKIVQRKGEQNRELTKEERAAINEWLAGVVRRVCLTQQRLPGGA